MTTTTKRKRSSRKSTRSGTGGVGPATQPAGGAIRRVDPPHDVDHSDSLWIAQQLQKFAAWQTVTSLRVAIERLSQDDIDNLGAGVSKWQRKEPGRMVPVGLIAVIAGGNWSSRERLLATALLPTYGALDAWAQLIFSHATDADILRRCRLVWQQIAAVPNGQCSNNFGDVFWNLYDGVNPAVEFGSRTGKPELIGPQLAKAIRELFGIGVPGKKSAGKAAEPVTDRAAELEATEQDGTDIPVGDPPAIDPTPTVPIDSIDVVHNARTEFDRKDLDLLAKSIKRFGILQPLLVASNGNRFDLVAGERRLRAALMAKLDRVPVSIVAAESTDAETTLMALEENLKRVDLNPIERARELKRLQDEHGMTQKQIAAFVGVTQGQVSNELRLLNLPEAWSNRVSSGQLPPTLVRQLLPFADVPAVCDGMEKHVETIAEEPTADTMKACLREVILRCSRPMKFDTHWSSYSKPDAKRRHFKTLSAADETELAPRTCDMLNDWEGKERTFNVEKFDELNKAPLAKLAAAHKAYKKKHARSSGGGSESEGVPLKPYAQYHIQHRIETHLARSLATALKTANDRKAIERVFLAMAILGEFEGVILDGDCRRLLHDMAGDGMRVLVTHGLAELCNPDTQHRIRAEDAIAYGEVLGVDVVGEWVPDAELFAEVTPHGLELCRDMICPDATETGAALEKRLLAEWPPGLIPPFLRPMFGLKAQKSPAKKK